MLADNILKLKPRPNPYGPELLLGEGSELIRDNFPKTIKKYAPRSGFVAEKLGKKGVTELERLGTALYVTNNPDRDVKDRALCIQALKPHISKEQAREAVKEVDAISKEAEKFCASE